MNWTPHDAIRFHDWEIQMMRWKAVPKDLRGSPPPKPANYDLWKQGSDPLNLASTKGACCQGGGLVPDTWTSNAIPVRLPEERLEQPNLL